MTAEIASAYLSRHQIQHGDVAGLLTGVHVTLDALASGAGVLTAAVALPLNAT